MAELVAFAASSFYLDIPGKDGSTRREHLIAAARMTKRTPPELLEAPELPPLAAHVWYWWLELDRTRGGVTGPAPITYQEIKAWADLTNVRPEPWEVDAIMAIDRAYLNRKEQ